MQYTTALILAAASLATAQSTSTSTSSASTSTATGINQSGCGGAIDAYVNNLSPLEPTLRSNPSILTKSQNSIITNCLASTGARVDSCADTDWDCLCANSQAVLTCYDNCPSGKEEAHPIPFHHISSRFLASSPHPPLQSRKATQTNPPHQTRPPPFRRTANKHLLLQRGQSLRHELVLVRLGNLYPRLPSLRLGLLRKQQRLRSRSDQLCFFIVDKLGLVVRVVFRQLGGGFCYRGQQRCGRDGDSCCCRGCAGCCFRVGCCALSLRVSCFLVWFGFDSFIFKYFVVGRLRMEEGGG